MMRVRSKQHVVLGLNLWQRKNISACRLKKYQRLPASVFPGTIGTNATGSLLEDTRRPSAVRSHR
jgi:hypothetical protein